MLNLNMMELENSILFNEEVARDIQQTLENFNLENFDGTLESKRTNCAARIVTENDMRTIQLLRGAEELEIVLNNNEIVKLYIAGKDCYDNYFDYTYENGIEGITKRSHKDDADKVLYSFLSFLLHVND